MRLPINTIKDFGEAVQKPFELDELEMKIKEELKVYHHTASYESVMNQMLIWIASSHTSPPKPKPGTDTALDELEEWLKSGYICNVTVSAGIKNGERQFENMDVVLPEDILRKIASLRKSPKPALDEDAIRRDEREKVIEEIETNIRRFSKDGSKCWQGNIMMTVLNEFFDTIAKGGDK